MTNKKSNIDYGFELAANSLLPDSWLSTKWRPAMGWMYMAVCIFDFIIFPLLWSLLQSFLDGEVTSQWEPLTLSGAGLFHVAMGAVLGITAYGRTQEKIKAVTEIGSMSHYAEMQNDDNDYYNSYQPRTPSSTSRSKKQSFAHSATTIPMFEGGPGDEE